MLNASVIQPAISMGLAHESIRGSDPKELATKAIKPKLRHQPQLTCNLRELVG